MIATVLVVTGWALLTLPGRHRGRTGLGSSEWARTAAASLAVGFLALEVGLALLAMPAIMRATHAMSIDGDCGWLFGSLPIGGRFVGWTAGAVAVVVAGRAVTEAARAHHRARGLAVEPWLGRHEDRGDYELVTLPTDRLLAMSVPGARSQVVISQGLVDHLRPDELEAVLAHEACHHRHHHWRYSLIAVVVERSLAPLRGPARSAASLRAAVEAWADESASRSCATGRSNVSRALLRVSQSGRAAIARDASVATVRERLHWLEHPASSLALSSRIVVLMPMTVLVVSALALLSGSIVGVHHARALSDGC